MAFLPVCGHKCASSATLLSGDTPQRPEINSYAPRPTSEPSLLRSAAPGARKECPQSSALRLCRPACSRLPLRSRWVIPLSVALAALDGVGHGQGVFVSKHSTAILKRRQHHEEVNESHPARRSRNLK